MNAKITELADKISKLEKQLTEELDKQREVFSYKLVGKKIKFEKEILEVHRKLKVAILPWLFSSTIRNILSSPFIYSMVIPIGIFDITITLYQHICFRLYNIRRVKRSDYIVLDRHRLAYLNGIEKLNCIYCGYGNGVVAYTREVIARTEKYWCPIKHARKVYGRHQYYDKFAAYGDGEHYQQQIIKMRDELKPEN
jgi:hypothetical protein